MQPVVRPAIAPARWIDERIEVGVQILSADLALVGGDRPHGDVDVGAVDRRAFALVWAFAAPPTRLSVVIGSCLKPVVHVEVGSVI